MNLIVYVCMQFLGHFDLQPFVIMCLVAIILIIIIYFRGLID